MVKKLVGIYKNRIRPRAKKIVIGLLIFFVLFTVIGFFGLPPLLKYILTKELSQDLHRKVTINQIMFNPYTLSTAVRGILIKDRSGTETFFSCDELFLNLGSLSAVRMAPVLKEIRITKPYVKIIRNKDLSYNFSDLLEEKKPVPPEKAKSSKPLRFSLNNIRIINGSVDFVDMPEETTHTVRELMVGIPFVSDISSYIETFVQPHFSAKVNGALFAFQGKIKPFADSRETSINFDIKDLNIPHYLAYVPVKMNFKVVSASLDTEAKVSFIETKDKKPSLTITGSVSLKNTAVDDAKGKPLLKIPLLDVSVAPSEPLLKTVHLSKVSIQSPEYNVERDEKGVFNTQFLLYEKGKERVAAREAGEEAPFFLDVDTVVLTGGKISFTDLSRSIPFKTVLDPVDLKVDHFSNAKDKKAAYALSLSTEAKESVKVQGEFSMVPLGSEGALEVSSVLLKKYSPFYKDNVLFDIEDGHLDLAAHYRYASGQKEPEVSLSGISVTLNTLRLRKTGENEDFVKVPNFTIKETDVNLTKRELNIGSLSTEKGEILVKRLSKGDLNLLTLTPSATPPASAPKEPPKKPNTGEKPIESEKPWLVSLKQMLIDKYTIRVVDQTTKRPVTLVAQNLTLRGENISTAKSNKARLGLSLLLNGKGTVSTAGTLAVEPLSADLKIGLKGIEIAPFQPYFTDKVKLTVTGGAISTNGNVSLTSTKEKGIKATYKGEASVTNFSSIDKLSGADLLKLESLSLNDINVAYAPLSIGIKGVSLTNFYALVAVSPEGKINLQEVLAAEEPKAETTPGRATEKAPGPARQQSAAASPQEKEPSKNIRIDQVTLQDGRIDFQDKSVKPEFLMHLTEIGGRVSGLSADQNTTADVELRGKLNDYAPLEITGKINPLKDDLFVDIKARIKDMDLSPTSPYSGKYAGYGIEKGKLSLDVKYSISNRKLDSQNNIVIDQFTFGDKVDSAQATHLPVKLAVALLKDRTGEIKLDLPVTGSLDDPKFSVWQVILHIIVNLIAKAATSPFALLGAVFGGGEELSYVEFPYGSTVITEPDMNKIDTVAKALEDRPALKLDIEGYADTENDREGLKQLLFNRKIKAQKLNEMVKKGQPAIPVDDVKIDPSEYDKYLKMAYKAEKFPKPTNFIGMTKDIPVPEMEKLMLTHTEVNDGDLRALASQRAMNVEGVILKSGKVDPGRVFVLEPKSLAPEKKEKAKASRVDFKLK
ncbi:MAG TPA: DUF748 domain-containing protein [Syntrophorhabdales bacterium]|nr:DUF748 domain-containing protein [Syntrophorhabdales bacterium]